MSANPFNGTPYHIVRLLGEGGMGEVYEVEHEVVGKLMVAKVLRAELAEDSALVDRMRVEAQALAAISHPNIVNVTDFRRCADGRPFYVMESLKGVSLGQELRARGPLTFGDAIDVARQVLRGLAAAHALGLVHRDIKLDNVFLHWTSAGERVVKVLDFGVAKVLSEPGTRGPAPPSLPTAEGAIVGTPRWASPEQVRGKGVDHRADIYAVGLLLYTLVAGRGPFDHLRRPEDLFTAHLDLAPDSPSKFAPAIPQELDAAILRALAKAPGDRFQSAEAFELALGAILERRNTPIGWLQTVASPMHAAGAGAESPNTTAPMDRAELSDWTEPRSPVDEVTVREGQGEAAAGPTPTEILGRPSPRVEALLETHTAPPRRRETGALIQASTAQSAALPSASHRSDGSSGPVAYIVAAVTAVITSALGLWLSATRSLLASSAVFAASVAAAALAAWLLGGAKRNRS